MSADSGEWEREQARLSKLLVLEDAFDWTLSSSELSEGVIASSGAPATPLKYIGGMDISFVKDDPVNACACLVVLEFPSLEVVFQRTRMVELTLPYVSGFLAFRECPFLLQLLEEVAGAPWFPQLIMVDGNGVLHPRGFGLACQLGVGKTFLHVDGLTKDEVLARAAANTKAGDFVELVGESGRVWAAALRSTDDAPSPVFVSQGHRISLATAVAVVAATTNFRVPEPVRQADLRSREAVREWLKAH